MRRLPLLVATLVALHVALPVGAEAQERTPPPPTSAVGAARALFDALASREWSRAAAAFDSGQVAEFRQRELAVAATYLSQRDAVGHGSGGISAVGASAMADSAQIARYARTPLAVLRGTRTLGEVAALAPRDLLARYFEAWDDVAGQPSERRGIVGEVAEGDTLAHVLYRASRPDSGKPMIVRVATEPWAVQVLTLRKRDGRWNALPNGELFFFGSMIMLDGIHRQR